jgi:nicotinamidase-related amidase
MFSTSSDGWLSRTSRAKYTPAWLLMSDAYNREESIHRESFLFGQCGELRWSGAVIMIQTAQGTKDDAQFFAERGFGQRIGFGERPALVIIDMLNAFTDEKAMLGANLDKEIAAIIPLLTVAHDRGVPVIFSTVRYDDADLKDAGIWALKQKGVMTLKADGHGWEVDLRLDFRKTDTLLVKKYASCFFGTDLVPRLLAHRVDTLTISGCTTSGCVRATAVDACQTGFRPMVVREAVGDRSIAAHAQSLFDLDAKYADVVSQHDAVAYLDRVDYNSARRG